MHSTEEVKVVDRKVKLEEMLSSLIERGGYSRNRQAILESVGVTAAALSQYVRGHTRPSFQRLVALADFFGVSLDYLVYGEPVSAPSDNGSPARYVERALADVRTQAGRHSDLMTRIGRVLADHIDVVARELAESRTAGVEGLIEQDEALRVERYCQQADIVATDLGPDVIAMPGGDAAAGQFFQVVTANLAKGCKYRFLLAGELGTRPEVVTRFRGLVAAVVGGDQLNENCSFRRTVLPVMGGAGLYRLDVAPLAMEEPALFTQFSKYLLNGTWLGYLIRPNQESNTDMLMSPSHTERACWAFDALWNAAGAHV
ncbi:MAG: helix-turn-helix domain-containing protein [Actinophytocola sp.]|uniref:helix-turn-helix domain-containing protein n=1 Tax=Actinophytocola sp. TaxID=1872138 RepID=UPI00132B15F6|nr:helix-turn-helix transcriptional regulator [Actinophytocola sp.]MPZ82341.1 helix-turn-helix domain-containing protein [Actinophytocola sp.]